jgi:hypothetical protein
MRLFEPEQLAQILEQRLLLDGLAAETDVPVWSDQVQEQANQVRDLLVQVKREIYKLLAEQLGSLISRSHCILQLNAMPDLVGRVEG